MYSCHKIPCTPCTHAPTHPRIHPLTHPPTHPFTHPPTLSRTHVLTYSRTHVLTLTYCRSSGPPPRGRGSRLHPARPRDEPPAHGGVSAGLRAARSGSRRRGAAPHVFVILRSNGQMLTCKQLVRCGVCIVVSLSAGVGCACMCGDAHVCVLCRSCVFSVSSRISSAPCSGDG